MMARFESECSAFMIVPVTSQHIVSLEKKKSRELRFRSPDYDTT